LPQFEQVAVNISRVPRSYPPPPPAPPPEL
jgi:hypothetical protein